MFFLKTLANSEEKRPNSLECRTMVRLKTANKFVEFQRPCTTVIATKVDNEVVGVQISAQSILICTATVGFQDDNMSTVILVSQHTPVTIKGADRLRCTTEENHGINYDTKQDFELFTLETVNESRNTIVIDSNKIFFD
jgi:hypothetical protein